MQQLMLSNYSHIVIFAPHPDDELLGCSSILFDEELRNKIGIVYLTDGCFYNYPTIRSKEAADIRKKELEELCTALKIHYYYCGIKDTHLGDTDEGVIKTKITEALKQFGYDYKSRVAFFMPHQKEIHDDHKNAFFKVRNAIFDLRILSSTNSTLFNYEVWTPMEKPLWSKKVNPIKKANLMRTVYTSQNTNFDYAEGILGLNRYRGMQQLSNDYYEVFS